MELKMLAHVKVETANVEKLEEMAKTPTLLNVDAVDGVMSIELEPINEAPSISSGSGASYT